MPRVNQFERLSRIMDRVSYKPGWTLMVIPPDRRLKYVSDTATVTVQYKAADISGKDASVITVGIAKMVNLESIEKMSDEQVIQIIIGDTIRGAEEHEFREWFKVDGVCVIDPHPESWKEAVS